MASIERACGWCRVGLSLHAFRCPRPRENRERGELRDVPSAVRGTSRTICHWPRPGRRSLGKNPSQKTGQKGSSKLLGPQRL